MYKDYITKIHVDHNGRILYLIDIFQQPTNTAKEIYR